MPKSRFLKNELLGVVCITVAIGLLTGGLFLYEKINPSYAETHVAVSDGGGGMRGMFVLWLLLIIVFTTSNALISLLRRLKRPRSS